LPAFRYVSTLGTAAGAVYGRSDGRGTTGEVVRGCSNTEIARALVVEDIDHDRIPPR
jgi:hypothetical protein